MCLGPEMESRGLMLKIREAVSLLFGISRVSCWFEEVDGSRKATATGPTCSISGQRALLRRRTYTRNFVKASRLALP